MARWYDGYKLCGYHIYNPVAVVKAISRRTFKNYWSNTGLYESVTPLIDMNYQGLKNALVKMLAGEHVDVDVTTFSNDVAEIRCKDHVLTYLIHLGYLAYDSETRTAYIPNEENRKEIVHVVKNPLDVKTKQAINAMAESGMLTADIISITHVPAELVYDYLGYVDMKGYRFDMKKIRSIMPSFGQNDVEQFLSEYFDEYKQYGTPI